MWVIAVSIISVLISLLTLALIFRKKNHHDTHEGSNKEYFTHGAVATDAKECSEIGRDMLQKGGHAVDAAIASLICTGVVNFHSTGIGGGGFMTVYDKSKKKAVVYDYREVGPSNIHPSIYDGDSDKAKYGGLAVGVPGEIRGLKKVHEKYGKLAWEDLLQGAINLAEKGTRIGLHMAGNLKGKTLVKVTKDTGLRELLFENGVIKKEGDLVINKKYANTLRILQYDPENLYTGTLSKIFLQDVKEHGGNMKADDLKNYKVLVKEPIINSFKGFNVHTTPLPGGGSVLTHILNMVQGYDFRPNDLDKLEDRVLTYHRLVESFKFSYAMRPHLGDPNTTPKANETIFNKTRDDIVSQVLADIHRKKINDSSTQKDSYYDPFFTSTEDDGTTHVSVIDNDGNAVAATDTINYAFGAKFRSTKSGIIYNNGLADYFIKNTYGDKYPTPLFNAPLAGRRPLSSTCPSIITDSDGNVKMVVGASGGARITLSTAWVIIKKLIFDYTLSDAILDARPQHSFSPPYIRIERKYSLTEEMIYGLRLKNHEVKVSEFNAIVQGIFVDGDKIYAKSDPRKEGIAAGY